MEAGVWARSYLFIMGDELFGHRKVVAIAKCLAMDRRNHPFGTDFLILNLGAIATFWGGVVEDRVFS
jgi:hypothetical protein